VVALLQTIELPLTKPPKDNTLIYVVHGLTLVGQSAQSDGGTAVTVCAGGDPLLTDFQFGDIAGPLELEIGTQIPSTVPSAVPSRPGTKPSTASGPGSPR